MTAAYFSDWKWSLFLKSILESLHVELTDLSCIQFHDWTMKAIVDPLFYFRFAMTLHSFLSASYCKSIFSVCAFIQKLSRQYFHSSIIQLTVSAYLCIFITLCSHRDFIYIINLSSTSHASLLFCWHSFIIEEKYLVTWNIFLSRMIVRLFLKLT